MPTLSQCQILNGLIERNLVSNEDKDADVTEPEEAQSRPMAIVGYAGSSTPQPEHSELLFENENPRSVSVSGRLETSRQDSDLDITPFQINRMQMAVNTVKIEPAWRPSSLWKKNINSFVRPPLYLWNIRNNLSQVKKNPDKTKDKSVPYQDVDTRIFSPLNKAWSKRHLLISPVLDDISLKHRRKPRHLDVPKIEVTQIVETSGEESAAEEGHDDKKPEDKEQDAVPAGDKPEEAGRIADDDAKSTDGIVEEFIVPKHKRFFNVKCPDDIKDQLYMLGWRKPRKKKSKVKKKQQEIIHRHPQLSYMTMPTPKLDLTNDPLLIKLSKKSKTMMRHTQPPDRKPKAVCFDIFGAHLTHLIVWKSFQRDILSELDEITVESIQFSPRALFFPRTKNSDPIENRWVITLTNEWYRSRVTGMEIHFGEFTTELRRYDDVIGSEYRQYTRMSNIMKMVKLQPPGLETITSK